MQVLPKQSLEGTAKQNFSQVFLLLCNYLYYYNVLSLPGGVKIAAKGLEDSQLQKAFARAGRSGLAPLPTAAPGAAGSWPGASPALGRDGQASASPSNLLLSPLLAGEAQEQWLL